MSLTFPPELLQFLAQKKPRISGVSYHGGDVTLELLAGRELDSEKGVLQMQGASASDVECADVLCAVEWATEEDLSVEQRAAIPGPALAEGRRLCVFHTPDGRRFYCLVKGLSFCLKPWFDMALTDRARRLNAEQGHTARYAVQSHFAASPSELIGKEVICWYCLRRFPFERAFMPCPQCDCAASACSPEGLLCGYFQRKEDLYTRSGCGLLQAKEGLVESYRLIIYSYWLNHRIVEVEKTQAGARLSRKGWDWKKDEWVRTADRTLTPAEWRRASDLIRLAPFWELPPHGGNGGFDGADYTLEGMKEGIYHFVTRWSPHCSSDQENFAHACGYLQELA